MWQPTPAPEQVAHHIQQPAWHSRKTPHLALMHQNQDILLHAICSCFAEDCAHARESSWPVDFFSSGVSVSILMGYRAPLKTAYHGRSSFKWKPTQTNQVKLNDANQTVGFLKHEFIKSIHFQLVFKSKSVLSQGRNGIGVSLQPFFDSLQLEKSGQNPLGYQGCAIA